MTEYHSVNVKLSDSRLDKLKAAAKNAIGGILWLSPDTISINENNFPHNLLLTDKQVKSLHKAFANNSSKDIKLLETQISKTIQSTEFFGRLLGPLLKVSLPLMKNLLQSLDKILLIPLGLTAAVSAINAGIQKKS